MTRIVDPTGLQVIEALCPSVSRYACATRLPTLVGFKELSCLTPDQVAQFWSSGWGRHQLRGIDYGIDCGTRAPWVTPPIKRDTDG